MLFAGGCGNGSKPKKPTKPIVQEEKKDPPPETEEDRENQRKKQRYALVPNGSSCLPLGLKDEHGMELHLADVDGNARICAVDTDMSRALGVLGCWNVDLKQATLDYQGTDPLPGGSFRVPIRDRCARGFCVPEDASADGKTVILSWNLDGKKVAMLVADDIHLFDAGSKKHESSFPIRGPKGIQGEVSAIHYIAESAGGAVFVEGGGDHPAVWVYKADGTAVGAIEPIGAGKDAKPLSTKLGSFTGFDKDRVAIAERGFTAMTVYEIATGRKSKLSRKVSAGPCKKEELDAYWKGEEDSLGDKCKKHMSGMFGHLVHADLVRGERNFLTLLRGPRLGEFAVLDPTTLTEKKAIMLPWCDGPSADDDEGKAGKKESAKAADKSEKKAKSAPRGGSSKKAEKDEDPDAGGE
ncbi:MAG: hypothetical protein KIT31_00330 [Deltaproteobacteria bacterium]|nr:hypothetical protein [Deltaproteobacteria bacterium]